MQHDLVANKGIGNDGLKAHFDILLTSGTGDFPWEKKFYSRKDFNRLKKDHGAKFTGPLMEWCATPEGKKTFEAQKAAALAKGSKGSQNSRKQREEYNPPYYHVNDY